jgi:hypothetical protein
MPAKRKCCPEKMAAAGIASAQAPRTPFVILAKAGIHFSAGRQDGLGAGTRENPDFGDMTNEYARFAREGEADWAEAKRVF